jgi:hypothetical protein
MGRGGNFSFAPKGTRGRMELAWVSFTVNPQLYRLSPDYVPVKKLQWSQAILSYSMYLTYKGWDNFYLAAKGTKGGMELAWDSFTVKPLWYRLSSNFVLEVLRNFNGARPFSVTQCI